MTTTTMTVAKGQPLKVRATSQGVASKRKVVVKKKAKRSRTKASSLSLDGDPVESNELPPAVKALIESFSREQRVTGRFLPTTYLHSMGIFVLDKGSWTLVLEKNTSSGIKRIGQLAITCERWNVPFSVFLREPLGLRALEVVYDVPTGSRESALGRACVETSKRVYVDLMEWVESSIPQAQPLP